MNRDLTMPLAAGLRIPAVGFGTYLVKDAAVIGEALRAGYRHLDTAEVYENEEAVGAAVHAAMDGGLSRDDLFITTKLWPGNSAWGQEPRTRATAMEAMDASLAKLGLEQVDLYLIHAPFDPEQRLDQWRGLVDIQQQGKARAIGVSNFSAAHIEQLRGAGLPLPAANQIELHPWSQKPELVSYLSDNGILPIAYSSLVPLATWRAAAGQNSAKTEEMKAEGESPDSPFRKLAEKYDVSEAQLLLRWALQKGYPILPKSGNPERIRQNIDLFAFAIDDADMAAMDAMDRGDGLAWSVGDPTRLA